jgi:hypothetical protein
MIEEVTVAPKCLDFQHSLLLELWITWQLWRFATAEISKNESEIFARRIARDSHILRKSFVFRWLLYTLARPVIAPAMIKAPDAVAFDNAD